MIERHFSVSCYMASNTSVEMVLDASPWCIAGILMVNGTPEEYFSDALSTDDLMIFDHERGQAEGPSWLFGFGGTVGNNIASD